jgi:hypothetical protein
MSLLSLDVYDTYKYYFGITAWDCQQTLADFSLNGGILVASGYFDADTGISPTNACVNLSVFKNPREFIRRRGRILRRSEGKSFAYLFDAVVILRKAHNEADKSTSIIEAEFTRAVQFDEGAITVLYCQIEGCCS